MSEQSNNLAEILRHKWTPVDIWAAYVTRVTDVHQQAII